MLRNEYDYLFKFLLIGNSGVGKSCLLLRFAEDSFTDSYISTIGIDFRYRTIEVGDKTVKLQVWDSAGQERFRTINQPSYRGVDGILLLFDTTSRETFDELEDWISEIDRYAPENVSKILVGTKADLIEERQVAKEEAQAFADKLNMPFIQTSAKTDVNVNEAFVSLSRQALQTRQPVEIKRPNASAALSAVPAQAAETIGFWSAIARGAGKFFMGILWPFQMLWSGVRAVGRGIASGIASLFSALSNPPAPSPENQPPAELKVNQPAVYSSQHITDLQRAAGMQPPGSSNRAVVGQEVKTQDDLQRQIEELKRAREQDRVSLQALLQQNNAPPPPYEAQESPDGELKSIQSVLLSAGSSLLLDRACESTDEAKSYLEKVCLAIALIKDEKQRASCTTDLARKANEYEVLKSNLVSLQQRMQSLSKTIPVKDSSDNAAFNEIVRCGMIVGTAAAAITQADQLKRTLTLRQA